VLGFFFGELFLDFFLLIVNLPRLILFYPPSSGWVQCYALMLSGAGDDLGMHLDSGIRHICKVDNSILRKVSGTSSII
jgi:hypothetical protein